MSEEAPVREPTSDEKALARARAIYDAGDYVLLREVAGPLLKSEDQAVRVAAQELLAKVEIDPVAKWIGVGTLFLLLAITYWWVIR